jgi:predicted phage tail protein
MTSESIQRDAREAEAAALLKVQQRVASIGLFAVAIHGVFGTIAGAYVVHGQGRQGAAWALLCMSAIIGMLTCTGIRLILRRRLWSPVWLCISVVPAIAAAFWLA